MKEFIFIWRIENISFSWHNDDEELISPTFTPYTIEETEWTLDLNPRNIGKEEGIDFFLSRAQVVDEPKTNPIKCELSFLDSNGAPLCCEVVDEYCKGVYGQMFFMLRHEVFQNRDKYLPQDTLTAKCRMFTGTGDITATGQSSARTKIVVDRISFVEEVKDFQYLKPSEKKYIDMKSSKVSPLLSMAVFLTDGLCCEEKVVVEVLPIDNKNFKVFACKLFMSTDSKEAVKCGQREIWVEIVKEKVLKFLLPISKKALVQQNTLLLQCDAAFSTSQVISQIEQTVYGPQLLPNFMPMFREENKCEACISINSRGGALDALKSLHNDQIMTDVEMKTKTGSFPSHKAVLCARSPVFKAMFVNDMKEKTSDCIDIPDLEDDIVRRFLLFLYTDSVEDLQWDTAIKLYYAADKYQVQTLKEKCSSFLMNNINNSNASEVLVLADMHQDADLEKSVRGFILKHEEEVFGSHIWLAFADTHPKLAVKTMCLKYTRSI